MTVAMPIYKCEIAWLSLESLCNQKQVNFEWELIIIEEEQGAFGIENIKPFLERLGKAGMTRLFYKPIPYRIPLCQKWKMLAEEAREEIFVFWSADDYHPPLKLRTAYDAIHSGHDWVHYRYALFFDIKTQRHVYFDTKSILRQCGNIIAAKTADVKNVPKAAIPRGNDQWLYARIAPKNPYMDVSEDWKNGFATDGFNTLSTDRRNYYTGNKKPFFKTDLNVKNILPEHLYTRLCGIEG